MISSMTGFGRYEAVRDKIKITAEIKAVNHRYLDINVKIPKKLSSFEGAVRGVLKDYIQRGKVDVFITYEDSTQTNDSLHYNEALAGEYLMHLRRMEHTFGIGNDISVSTLARFPDVFTMEDEDTDEAELESVLREAVQGAAEQFVDSRVTEGERLKADLLGKLDEMLSYMDFIEQRYPRIIAEYREKLTAKVRELIGDRQVDDARIITEVTVFADKICVDEETVRLRSHIEAVKSELLQGGSVGRKLDFIAQELNREANTILSKATDLAISDAGIELKTSIEKVREQIQNIE